MEDISSQPLETMIPHTDLERKIVFLRDPSSYPEGARHVEAKETHMSWVFLTEQFAYKLKKPVRFDYLDFSTVDMRLRNCEAELHLNRRFTPEVYLDIVPLVQDSDGSFHIGGKGHIVDWLVKMRRLPDGGTLQDAIANKTVRKEDIVTLVSRLIKFYAQADRLPIGPRTYRLAIAENIEDTHSELCRPIFQQDLKRIDDIAGGLTAFVSHHGDLLEARASNGKLVDGHGDLRPEHIYLGQPPLIIDCIEFNSAFRTVDPVDELAYLAMECERLGAGFIHGWIFDTYRASSGDVFDERLVAFHKAYRGFIRAKIAIWHLADITIRDHEKWIKRCSEYLQIALRQLDGSERHIS